VGQYTRIHPPYELRVSALFFVAMYAEGCTRHYDSLLQSKFIQNH
jgi:hypothetical protein